MRSTSPHATTDETIGTTTADGDCHPHEARFNPPPIGRLRSGEIASFTARVRYVRYTSLGDQRLTGCKRPGSGNAVPSHRPLSLFATPHAGISQFALGHRSRAIAAIKIATADADVTHSHKFSDLSKYAIVPWLLIE